MSRAISATIGIMTRHAWRTGANLPAQKAIALLIGRANAYSGNYFVGTTQASEIVVYSGQPAARRVSLFIREANGFRLIRQTWSDPLTGSYAFPYVRSGVYFVLAEDYLQQKTIVTADPIQALPMP